MKQLRLLALAFVLIMVFSSCTLFRFAYSPTVQQIPAFKEKGESRITAIAASTLVGTESSYSLQGAYAVSDHFALTAAWNGPFRSQDELTTSSGSGTSSTEIVKYNRHTAEFGAGEYPTNSLCTGTANAANPARARLLIPRSLFVHVHVGRWRINVRPDGERPVVGSD